jgi:diaminohydroxyphosphoribosylaminopyrimidine deaminase/5-amino-6-(5-phosphoribosylamino)uracil reductase
VVGATAYVTLEPCSHHGRTPPCCDALIAAQLARVVVAAGDPNHQVNGQGVARLRAAGLVVEWADEAARQASRALNIGFFSRMVRGRPWVRMKLAGSLDGRSALPDGQSQWITAEAARKDGHAWRRRAGAILTGVGTVRADDPLLDTRWAPSLLAPVRAVVDSGLNTPASSRLLHDGGGRVRIYHLDTANPRHAATLRAAGACLVSSPAAGERVDLNWVLEDLGRLPLNELHVEAGAVLSGALLARGWVDEIVLYQAPMLLGPGRALVDLPTRTMLPQHAEWQIVEASLVGTDLRLRLQPSGRAGF